MNTIVENNFTFFLVTPLNLELACESELRQKFALHFPDKQLQNLIITDGGIEFECTLQIGLLLNTILRTPTRILLRISQFKCRDFPKLFNKISKINWSPWMIGQKPVVHSSASNSRLFDSRKIEKAVADGVVEYYKKQPIKKKYLEKLPNISPENLPAIYVRIIEDLCTISVDTSGDRLHLRGEKTFQGHAPIRENLAAILLILLSQQLKAPLQQYHLIDPMCGSGTFLYECEHFYETSNNRTFSFHYFPAYMEHIPSFNINIINDVDWFRSKTGFDVDSKIVAKTRTILNSKNIFHEDLFNDQIHKYENSIIITNPPYGIRVGENIDEKFYYRCIDSILKKYNPKIIGIIIPEIFKIKEQKNFQILKKFKFSNGGIDVFFYVVEPK